MNQETKNTSNTSVQVCQNCKNDFVIEPEDFVFYDKIKVPPPTFCPECRNARRLAWRNQRSLHKRTCNLCEKSIITFYDTDSVFPVYCNECFYGDGWDPMIYAMDVDFSRPFLRQWFELWNKVPKFGRVVVGNVKDSDYANVVVNSNHCYLAYSITGSEQIMYSESIDNSKSIMDSYMSIEGCDSCYYAQGRSNYACKYISQCASSINCYFCFDCSNCQDCFMSSSLRNKKYVFRNIQLTKDEYKDALEKENLKSRKVLDSLFVEWKDLIENKAIHQYARIVSGENTTGNFTKNTKNIKNCFNIYNSENIAYGCRIYSQKDSYDGYGVAEGELMYECVACSYGSNKNIACLYSMSSSDIAYSFLCSNSNNLFGCFSLSKKSYCILNKQYEKEEYFEMVEKIKKHMDDMPYIDKKGRVYKYGDFLPFEFSPHGYNETIAFDFFVLTKKESEEKGYNWYIPKEKKYEPTIENTMLPDTISEATDEILKQIIPCRHNGTSCNHQCTSAFKIAPDELLFYRKMNIPIPHTCPNCRHYERLPIFMPPMKLWHRVCMKEGCNNEFETSYAPDRPEIVYCEKCYQQEVM